MLGLMEDISYVIRLTQCICCCLGLYSAKLSLAARRKCAWSLFLQCHAQELSCTDSSSTDLSTALTMLNVVSLLKQETDVDIIVSLLCMALALTHEENDDECISVAAPFNVPCVVFCALLSSLMRLMSVSSDSQPVNAAVADSSSFSSGSLGTSTRPVSGIHAKRKLSSLSRSNSQCSNNSESRSQSQSYSQSPSLLVGNDAESSQESSQSVMGDESMGAPLKRMDSYTEGSVCERLFSIWPDVVCFLCGSSQAAPGPLLANSQVDFAISLNLLVLHRIMCTTSRRVYACKATLLNLADDDEEIHSRSDKGTHEEWSDEESHTNKPVRSRQTVMASLKQAQLLLSSMQESYRCISKNSSPTPSTSSDSILARKSPSLLNLAPEVAPFDCAVNEMCRHLIKCLELWQRASLAPTSSSIKCYKPQVWLLLLLLDSMCADNKINQARIG